MPHGTFARRTGPQPRDGRREALQLAFVGLALTLDAQGLLRYHASKTPAECAREAPLGGDGRRAAPRAGARTLRPRVRRPPVGPDDYRRWRDDRRRPWHAAGH